MKKILLNALLLGGLAFAQPIQPEVVARFSGPMPTGVAVSRTGRVFVNFPRWGDAVTHTVAEIKNGREAPFPSAAYATYDPKRPAETLVSVQSVVVDALDRLWILDTGSIQFGAPVAGGPKLVQVDLKTDKVVQTIAFPADVVRPATYLNDVRVDVGRNLAYITDSAGAGPNGIIVVDLKSGSCWRKLDGHRSVEEEPNFLPLVEGLPMYNGGKPLSVGADGIALSPDGSRLYYSVLAGRRLFSVSTAALADRQADAGATVKDEGDKGGAADGLEMDAAGNLYATNYEHASILRRGTDGKYSLLARLDPKDWPDTLAVTDGYVYVGANQLQRGARFQSDGQDRRQKPYTLYRIPVTGVKRQQPTAAVAPVADIVTTASGLRYQILQPGQGAVATPGRTVVVHYTGWLENGTQFDSSRGRGPFDFPLGARRVIAGWEEGVAGMKIGEKRKLIIPARLGYGDRGAGGVIPPGATLIFEVELLEVR